MNLLYSGLETVIRKSEELKDSVLQIPESARLVRTATNNEHWGCSGTVMGQIADYTFNFTEYTNVMDTLWARLSENTTLNTWRNIYKSLLLLDYLIKNGSERVVNDSRHNLILIKSLQRFNLIDEDGQDRGLAVRERAKQISDLLNDVDRLRDERKKFKQNRNKFNTSITNSSTAFDDFEPQTRKSTYSERDYGRDDFENTGKDDFDMDDEFRDIPVKSQLPEKPALPKDPPKPHSKETRQSNFDKFDKFDNFDDFNPRSTIPSPTPVISLTSQSMIDPFIPTQPTGLKVSVSVETSLGPSVGTGLGSSVGTNLLPSVGLSFGSVLGTSSGTNPQDPFTSGLGPRSNTDTASKNSGSLSVSDAQTTNSKKNELWGAHQHLFNSLTSEPAKPAPHGKTLSSTVGTGNLFSTPSLLPTVMPTSIPNPNPVFYGAPTYSYPAVYPGYVTVTGYPAASY